MFFSRGKNKIQDCYTFADMYEDYISKLDKDSIYYVDYSEYIDICDTFYKLISKSIIDDGTKFKMPWALGDVSVIKQNSKYVKKTPIDWKATNEIGKVVYNFNDHSAGYTYKYFWSKPYKLKNKFTYKLVMTRNNKRALAKAIKQNKKDYLEKY